MSPTVYSPPVATYVALAETTLASGSGSITFSSIPSSYRDLVLIVAGTTNNDRSLLWRANGDTGSNYAYVEMKNVSSTPTSTGASSENRGRFTNDEVITDLPFILHSTFLDYSATDKHKTVLNRVSCKTSLVSATANRWSDTTAISSIEIFVSVAQFKTGTTFSLYGIEA